MRTISKRIPSTTSLVDSDAMDAVEDEDENDRVPGRNSRHEPNSCKHSRLFSFDHDPCFKILSSHRGPDILHRQ